jgi:hypothetical protein
MKGNMLDEMNKYPEAPGFKVPGTSQEAAREMSGRAPNLRERVYEQILRGFTAGHGGKTADEVAESLHETVLSVRPRVAELKRMGRIRDSSIRRRNISGMKAAVWIPTEAAKT